MQLNRITGKSFDFACPPDLGVHQVDMQMPTKESQSLAYNAAIALNLKAKNTYVQIATLTGNVAMTAVINAGMKPGATLQLYVTNDDDATDDQRTITFGSGFLAPVFTGVILKNFILSFIYTGTVFVPTGAYYQLD